MISAMLSFGCNRISATIASMDELREPTAYSQQFITDSSMIAAPAAAVKPLIPNVVTTLEELESYLDKNENVVVKFYQDPTYDKASREMIPIDEQVFAKVIDKVKFINIDGKQHKNIALAYNITKTPSYLFFKFGGELAVQENGVKTALRITKTTDAKTLNAYIQTLISTPSAAENAHEANDDQELTDEQVLTNAPNIG